MRVNDKTRAEQNQRRIDQIRQTYIDYLDPVTLVSRASSPSIATATVTFKPTWYRWNAAARVSRTHGHSLRKAFEWFEKRVRDYAKRQGANEGMALAGLVETRSGERFHRHQRHRS